MEPRKKLAARQEAVFCRLKGERPKQKNKRRN
jgi:hypothetical protein